MRFGNGAFPARTRSPSSLKETLGPKSFIWKTGGNVMVTVRFRIWLPPSLLLAAVIWLYFAALTGPNSYFTKPDTHLTMSCELGQYNVQSPVCQTETHCFVFGMTQPWIELSTVKSQGWPSNQKANEFAIAEDKWSSFLVQDERSSFINEKWKWSSLWF